MRGAGGMRGTLDPAGVRSPGDISYAYGAMGTGNSHAGHTDRGLSCPAANRAPIKFPFCSVKCVVGLC